jgi:PHD/YefM family antitoxin component YafN of YafNO toxin-antitoxin module
MKVGQALGTVSYRLAIQHEVSRKLAQCRRDGDKLGGPIPAVPRPKPNVVTFLAGDDPEPVMLQFMQPAVAVRDAIGRDRLSGWDEARRNAAAPSRKRGTHQHGSPNLCSLRQFGSPCDRCTSGPWTTSMRRLASFEFTRNFGEHGDAALANPLVISRNGRDRLVVMNVDLYRELLDGALARKDGRAEALQARLRKAREQLQSRDDGLISGSQP